MTRKLLPYEHDLIEQLGVSKEDYLEFIALQELYNDPKGSTALDIRNDFGIAALVLAIVGAIFQVVSTLLAPRPRMPDMSGGGQQQTRDERFSPRFGFNSTQELALIGDPVHLVYANRGTGTGANPNGGVRVTASLLWSAVRSYGSSQYIQMLLMLAGGAITAIDNTKSAFGDTPVRDLITQNIWMYFDPGDTGTLTRGDEINSEQATDPSRYGSNTDNPYRLQVATTNTRVDGFSQAYSPTTANSCGVYNIVPLNVNLYLRDSRGDKSAANLGITASMSPWITNTSTVTIPVDTELTVRLAKTTGATSGIGKEAEEARRALASNFDSAGIFKLGQAIFRVTTVSNSDIDSTEMLVTLTCIKAGRAPSASYASTDATNTTGALTADEQSEYNSLNTTVTSLLNSDKRTTITSAGALANAGDIQTAVYGQGREQIDGDTYYAASQLEDGSVFTESDQDGYITFYRYTTTLSGYTRSRYLTTSEIGSLRRFVQLQAINVSTKTGNDIFYTKALARIETARYETMSVCHVVDMALKASVFKRINGRQTEYGSDRYGGYPVNDNGIKPRVSLFKLRYKEVGQSTFATVPGIFAIRRAADNDNFVYIKFNSGLTDPDAAVHWSFELEPISDPIAEKTINSQYFYLENTGTAQTETLSSYTLSSGSSTTPSIQFVGTNPASNNGYPSTNNNPTDLNEWDLFNYDADTQIQFSFDNGPEITVTAVSEQLIQDFDDYTVRNSSNSVVRRLYQNLSLFGFNAYSSKTIQDLRSFSVFVTQGRSVRKLRTSGADEQNRSWGSANYSYYPSTPDGASSFAPDIFLDTILDKEDGIGDYAVVDGIDLKQLAITKRFCRRNNLFMDCIIADPRSWREFWMEVAPYNLLEFARIGGRETLVPAVPYATDRGEITRTVNVSALFNQGNILEDSYKEEYIDFGSNMQDLIASIIYSDVPEDAVFANKKSVDVQLADTLEINAIRQTFDLSAYVSNEAQAILFGKLMCNTRRHVRQAIEFKTYPTSDPLSPGAYIYVDIGQNSWDSIRTGVVGVGGALNVPLGNLPSDGTYNFRLYRSDAGISTVNSVSVSSGTASALSSYENYLFVLGVEATSRRVFRVSEVTMDEEGEITVRASIYPCTTDGQSLIADFTDSLFTVRR